MQENREKINNSINDFFTRAGISNVEIKSVEFASDGSVNVSVFVEDASLCIGEGGRNIGSFENVLRLIIRKQIGEIPFFHLDINNYRNLKDEALKELARKAAHRARFYKRSVALEAMSAYDRRVIHTELSAHPDIKTESTGEGEKRRVIVKYVF